MFPSNSNNMFTSDSVNIFTSDLANIFTTDSVNKLTNDSGYMFTSDLAKMLTCDSTNMFTSDSPNMFVSELEKWKIMIWSTSFYWNWLVDMLALYQEYDTWSVVRNIGSFTCFIYVYVTLINLICSTRLWINTNILVI